MVNTLVIDIMPPKSVLWWWRWRFPCMSRCISGREACSYYLFPLFRKWLQTVFSMNVFKNKKRWQRNVGVKKRALNKKNVKNVFFTSMVPHKQSVYEIRLHTKSPVTKHYTWSIGAIGGGRPLRLPWIRHCPQWGLGRSPCRLSRKCLWYNNLTLSDWF